MVTMIVLIDFAVLIMLKIFTVMHVGDFLGTTLQCAVLTLFNNLCITLVVCQTKPYEQLSSDDLISKEKVSFDFKLKIQIYTLFLYYLPMSYVLVLFRSYLFPRPPSVFFSSVFCNSCILLAISYFLMVWVSMIDPVVWIKLYWIICCIITINIFLCFEIYPYEIPPVLLKLVWWSNLILGNLLVFNIFIWVSQHYLYLSKP